MFLEMTIMCINYRSQRVERRLDIGNAWILHCLNSEVTDFYLGTVGEAFKQIGFSVSNISAEQGIEELAKRAAHGASLRRKGFKNIVLWLQGVVPEESYLRNHCRARKAVLEAIEKRALKQACFLLFVSNAMQKHYENKYGLDFSDKSYVMPCCNTMMRPDLFGSQKRYVDPVFAYVGSLAAWQCFDETMFFFKQIEERIPGASLKVLTFQQSEAREKLSCSGINNWTLGCVPSEKVPDALSEVGYGFLLRRENVVNMVSTPTKLSSYLSCGVIPIFSSCVKGFYEASKAMRYVCPVSSFEDVDKVVDFVSTPPDQSALKEEYGRLFDSYYSRSFHIRKLAEMFMRRFSSFSRELA